MNMKSHAERSTLFTVHMDLTGDVAELCELHGAVRAGRVRLERVGLSTGSRSLVDNLLAEALRGITAALSSTDP